MWRPRSANSSNAGLRCSDARSWGWPGGVTAGCPEDQISVQTIRHGTTSACSQTRENATFRDTQAFSLSLFGWSGKVLCGHWKQPTTPQLGVARFKLAQLHDPKPQSEGGFRLTVFGSIQSDKKEVQWMIWRQVGTLQHQSMDRAQSSSSGAP